jgi:hypothetical protein
MAGRTSGGTSYLEWLRNGSPFHEVSLNPSGFAIRPAGDATELREEFHKIVDEAIEKASFEGYEILPHHSDMDPRGRWDFAVITLPA